MKSINQSGIRVVLLSKIFLLDVDRNPGPVGVWGLGFGIDLNLRLSKYKQQHLKLPAPCPSMVLVLQSLLVKAQKEQHSNQLQRSAPLQQFRNHVSHCLDCLSKTCTQQATMTFTRAL